MRLLRAPISLTPDLERTHAPFANARADDDPTHSTLVAAHHPFAAAYRVAREFFDALTHRAGPLQRLWAYADDAHKVIYSAPSISISWNPFGDFEKRFGRSIVPSSAAWPTYLNEAAAAAFPPEVNPSGHLGRFEIYVEDPTWARAIRDALAAGGITNWRPLDGRVTLRAYQLDRFTAIRDAVAVALPEWILPRREAMTSPDRPPAPPAAINTPPALDLFALVSTTTTDDHPSLF